MGLEGSYCRFHVLITLFSWCLTFSLFCFQFEKTESGWAAVNANGETAVDAGDLKPEPSLLGAGGLPKGHVNLGDQDEEFNMLF